jgi:hypothetical protein
MLSPEVSGHLSRNDLGQMMIGPRFLVCCSELAGWVLRIDRDRQRFALKVLRQPAMAAAARTKRIGSNRRVP